MQKKLTSELHQKYSRYWKDICVNMMLNRLKSTLRLATRKLEELENVNDETRPNQTFQSKNYRELTQDPVREKWPKIRPHHT